MGNYAVHLLAGCSRAFLLAPCCCLGLCASTTGTFPMQGTRALWCSRWEYGTLVPWPWLTSPPSCSSRHHRVLSASMGRVRVGSSS